MILNETYPLANGVQIPKLGLGTWFIDDATKTQTEIYESEDKPNGSTENPKADSHPD